VDLRVEVLVRVVQRFQKVYDGSQEDEEEVGVSLGVVEEETHETGLSGPQVEGGEVLEYTEEEALEVVLLEHVEVEDDFD
jgi:hypothetical protein